MATDFVDPKTGQPAPRTRQLAAAFGWFARGVKEGVIPANNTAMEFDALRKQFYTGNAVFWMYGIWDLGTYAFPTYGLPSDEAAFFADWGWIAAPAPKKGRAGSLNTRSSMRSRSWQRPRARRPFLGTPQRPISTPTTRSRRRSRHQARTARRPALCEVWPLARADRSFEDHQVPAEQSAFRRSQRHRLQGLARRGTGRLSRRTADFVIDEATARPSKT